MSERDGYHHGVPCWVETGQPDADAAAGFYRALFGCVLAEPFDSLDGGRMVVFADPTGAVLGCVAEPTQPVSRDVVAGKAPAPDGAPAEWQVDFWVADTDAAVSTAEEHGGRVVSPAADSPIARTAVLADPQGAVFSVSTILLET